MFSKEEDYHEQPVSSPDLADIDKDTDYHCVATQEIELNRVSVFLCMKSDGTQCGCHSYLKHNSTIQSGKYMKSKRCETCFQAFEWTTSRDKSFGRVP